jgi:hypothetical protein
MATKKVLVTDDGKKSSYTGSGTGRVFNADDDRADKYVQSIKDTNARLAGRTVDTSDTTAEADDDGTVERVGRPRGTK